MNTGELILCTSDLFELTTQDVSLRAHHSLNAAATVKNSLTVQSAKLAADAEDVKAIEAIGKKVEKLTNPRRRKS